MKIALSLLCENPLRKTGLSTTYHEFVARSLRLFDDLSWVVFVGPNQEWHVQDPRVRVVRDFPANDRLTRRLFADHFQVPSVARALGADVMVSTGFVPIRKRLPTVLHVFALHHLDKGNRVGSARQFYRHWAMKRTWPQADLVITNSKCAAAQILEIFPAFHGRLVQAYEGLQHEQFTTGVPPGEIERLQARIGTGPGYFLWLSNFYPYKQGDRLIAAYALLDRETRRRHPLVMAGGDWEGHLEACQRQARAAGVAADIRFLGWVEDALLAPLYRHALAHCLPSREETFGRTVIESMACGTPVIVNDIPIMREVTAGHAIIVPFANAEAVAREMRNLAQDPAARGRLREAGLRRAQDFTFEKFTCERITAIQRLLAEGRSRSLEGRGAEQAGRDDLKRPVFVQLPSPSHGPGVTVPQPAGPSRRMDEEQSFLLSSLAPVLPSTRPLRIIQVFNSYLLPGGEEKSVARIADNLERCGHSVRRFWRESAEWQRPEAPPRWQQAFLMWRNPAVLDELRRLQASQPADLWLLHNVVPVISLDVYRLARELKVPILQWLHNYRPISPSGTLFARRHSLQPEDRWIALREALAGSWNGPLLTAWLALGYARLKRRGDFEAVAAWVAISEETGSIFRRSGWFPDRLHVLRHSWNIQVPEVSGQDKGYYLFLGRMVESKGVRFLVNLWRDPALRERTLIMAGQGPLADTLRQSSPPNVRWVGHVDGSAKRELIAQCRAVLFPCLWAEPLGIVAYEAYEAGKPVLASNLGGLREIVQDGRTGRLLAAGDAAAWREAILGLDAGQARQLGLAGRKWLEENTSPEAWNRQFMAILQRTFGAS